MISRQESLLLWRSLIGLVAIVAASPFVNAYEYGDGEVFELTEAAAAGKLKLRGNNRVISIRQHKRELLPAAAADDLSTLEGQEYWDRFLQGSLPTPTVCGGLTQRQRADQITAEIANSGVSTNKDLANKKSSQGKALNWIINNDEAQLCPDARNMIQRYIMSVFYFSTEGDKWEECSAEKGANAPAKQGKDKGAKEAKESKEKDAKKGGKPRISGEEETASDPTDDDPLSRTGGAQDSDSKETNCLKYCRDKCCEDNGGERLCNSNIERTCRRDCFVETECRYKEAKQELEALRRGTSKSSESRSRWRNDEKDKRDKKDSRKGGRKKSPSRRELQGDKECGGPNSAFPGKTPYLSGSSECDWAGSRCNGGEITVIGFEQNNLGGTFPAEILALNRLRNLTLEGGKTSGTIPEQWGSGVWDGQSLQVLDLDQNRLEGTLSENLFNLDTLKVLDIDENKLEGTLSPKVGNLVDLVFVEFEENEFSGTIPNNFGKLTALRTATFRGNKFKGSMPDSVCNNRVPDGLLNILTADCAEPDPEIECSCCSSCF